MNRMPALVLLTVLIAGGAPALEVRGYDPLRHDRFTGFASSPVENPGFLHDAARFRGVGWSASQVYKQFTLVTPRHFLCATHFRPSDGSMVHFLDASGAVIGAPVVARMVVTNADGSDSDLALCELGSAIDPVTGVVPFPWLNLGSESAYEDLDLVVLGFYALGGSGVIESISDISDPGNPDRPVEHPPTETRAMMFLYRDNGPATGDDDAKLIVGDSGSPSFVDVSGKPAIVGIHSAVEEASNGQENYDSFVPHYIASLDALVAPQGYRMRPAYHTPTTVAVSASATPATFRRRHAGRIDVDVDNSGAAETGNLEVVVSFPAGQAPDSIDAPGWVVEALGPGCWSIRRVLFAAGGAASFAVEWDELPADPALAGTVVVRSDAAPEDSLAIDDVLLPSYAEWSEGLAEPGQEADPDGDGLSNLVEYALGGDPESGLMLLEGLHPLTLQAGVEGGNASISAPHRTDADLRGLSYIVEWSESLEDGSWTTTAPDAAVTSMAPWDPPVGGFERAVVSWPAGAGPVFCRLRIELDEG